MKTAAANTGATSAAGAAAGKDDRVYYNAADAAPVLDNIAALIEEARMNHDGKTLPRGFFAKLIEKKKPMFPWLTRARITSHIKKLQKEKASSSPPLPAQTGNSNNQSHAIGAIATSMDQAWSSASSLTHASNLKETQQKRKPTAKVVPTPTPTPTAPPTAPPTNNNTSNNNPNTTTTPTTPMAVSKQTSAQTEAVAAAAAAIVAGAAAATNDNNNNNEVTKPTKSPYGGRPRGPPTASQRARDERAARPKPTAEELDMAERITVTRAEAAAQYAGVKKCLKEKGFRVPNGTLAKIIDDCKERNGVPKETIIKPGSIQKRVRVKNFSVEPRYPVKYLVPVGYVFSDEEDDDE